MAKIEKYCAAGVYDPPGYSQAIKVTGVQTILFLAGQVPYEMDGTVKHRGDFRSQARAVFASVKALVEAGGGSLASVVKISTSAPCATRSSAPRVRPRRWCRSPRSRTRTI